MRHLTDLGQTHQKAQPKHKGRTGQLVTITAVFKQALEVATFAWGCEGKEKNPAGKLQVSSIR